MATVSTSRLYIGYPEWRSATSLLLNTYTSLQEVLDSNYPVYFYD